jgi:hypothetical protein
VGQEKVEGKARSEAHPMGQGLMAGARVAGYGLEGIELATAALNMGGGLPAAAAAACGRV